MATGTNSRIPFFGRAADLATVLQRIETPGVTIIAGLPQRGKTKLLEAVRDLITDGQCDSQSALFHVGYVDANLDEPNILKRSLEDLYRRWLCDASMLEQAQRLWHANKGSLIERLGEVAAGVGEALGSSGTPLASVGSLVNSLFGTLIRLNKDLTGESLNFDPPISIELARDLVCFLNATTKKRCVLILDGFDRSGNIERDMGNVDHFLRRIDEWAPCHFLIAVRDPPATDPVRELRAWKETERLRRTHPEPVCVLHQLGRMVFASIQEEDDVVGYIRTLVKKPEAWFDALDRDLVLQLLAGHPGTLYWWSKACPGSFDDLRKTEVAARACQYDFVRTALADLLAKGKESAFAFTVRLALLPGMTEESWEALRPLVLEGISGNPLPELVTRRILERTKPPSFGHATQYDATRELLLHDESLSPHVEDHLRNLIYRCASAIRSADIGMAPLAVSLSLLGAIGELFRIEDHLLGCCAAAALLTQPEALFARWSVRLHSAGKAACNDSAIAPLLSMALFNAFSRSSGEEAKQHLDRLGELYKAHSDDTIARNAFAKGLFNAFNHSAGKEAKEYLDQLRELHRVHRGDVGMRAMFAKGLFNACNHSAGDVAKGHLDHLHELYEAHSEHAIVRERLSRALTNAIGREESDARLATLVTEQSSLYQAHSDDAMLLEQLGSSLFNAIHNSADEDAKRYLDQLRELYKHHCDDMAVGESFSKGLMNAIGREEDVARRAKLVAEQRKLYQSRPADTAVREHFANGLFNALLNSAGEEAKGYLDRLGELHKAHRDDAAIREPFAQALCLYMARMFMGGDSEPSRIAINELQTLHEQYPDDAGVHKWYSAALERHTGHE